MLKDMEMSALKAAKMEFWVDLSLEDALKL